MVFGVVFGLPSLRIRGLYLAVATLAAQFFMDWMHHPRGLGDEQLLLGLGQRQGAGHPGLANRHAHGEVPAVPGHPVRAGTGCQKPGAQLGGPRMDGHARHGRGRQRDRHPPGVRQALGLCRQLFYRRHCRGAVGLCAPGLVGAGRLRPEPIAAAAVHDHHRWPGLHRGQHLWRRLLRAAAAVPEPGAALAGPAACPPPPPPISEHIDVRCPDRVLPDCGAARFGQAVGYRPAKSCASWPFPTKMPRPSRSASLSYAFLQRRHLRVPSSPGTL